MNHYCKYHPGSEALWYCAHDGLHLCQQCVDGRDDTLTEARCLLCNQDVDAVGQAASGPLWRQLDQYLQFPFTPVLLPVLLIWAAVAALLPALPVMVAVALLGGLPAWRFASATIALRGRPARGRRVATAPGWDCLTSDWPATALQALPALVLIIGAGFLMVYVSVTMGLLVGMVGLLLVPALWLAIAVKGPEPGSYAAAPTYMLTAPDAYLVAALFASLGWGLAVALVAVAVDVLPMPAVQGLAAALAALWWLALAALCGDILARYGRQWGLYQGVHRVTQPEAERRQRVLLCAGRFDKVLLATAKTLKTKKATLADWQRYDRLLVALNREQDRLAMAEPYLDVLVSGQAWNEAVALLGRLRAARPGWLPGSPSLRLALAQGVEERDPKLAVSLLKDLHDKHPEFGELGEAYLLLAKVLAEQFGLAGKAEQYLRFVESRCRDAKLRKQVADYRAAWG